MCGVLIGLVFAGSARGVLVYQRPPVTTVPRQAEIVVADDDGLHARVIARGSFPVVSPNGREVAFFAGPAGGGGLWVVSKDGRHRRRLVQQTQPSDLPATVYHPYFWSPDSRYIAGDIGVWACSQSFFFFTGHCSGTPGSRVELIGIRRGSLTRLARYRRANAVKGVAFSPDSRHIVLGRIPRVNTPDPYVEGTLELGKTLGPKHLRLLGPGEEPAWGTPGLAFLRSSTDPALDPALNEIDLVAAPAAPPRPLFKKRVPSGERLVDIVGWAAGLGDLLAGVADASTTPPSVQPVLIDPHSGAAQYFPQRLLRISAISRDGSTVLGESPEHQVVAVRADGTVRVLARHAGSASWSS